MKELKDTLNTYKDHLEIIQPEHSTKTLIRKDRIVLVEDHEDRGTNLKRSIHLGDHIVINTDLPYILIQNALIEEVK